MYLFVDRANVDGIKWLDTHKFSLCLIKQAGLGFLQVKLNICI